MLTLEVVDPGFRDGGNSNLKDGGANLLFDQLITTIHCMKMKEIGLNGGVCAYVPPGSTNNQD